MREPRAHATNSRPRTTHLAGRARVGYSVLFAVLTAFWALAAIAQGSVPQRVFCGVLALAFAVELWRAAVRSELEEDDDERLDPADFS